ncbi:MAG TPA: porin [Burkholderiaceae bacterium]|jgi:GBP family porin|nr:porin [Burkholderiaceae bacterium]
MKKSLVAVAVLGGFASVAVAQSSVTLYGRIDQNITYQDPGKNAAASSGGRLGKGVTKLNDGGVSGFGNSRWGLRGSEDLGDGLRAYFLLESSIAADTGAGGGSTVSGSSFFNRQAYIAIGSKTLGDIRLGRIETISRETNVRINDATGENEIGIQEVVASNRPLFQNFGTRIDNGVSYRSPVLGGFQGILTIGLNEDFKSTSSATPPVTSKASEYHGVGLIFGQGPFNAAVSYEEFSGGVVSGSYNKAVTVGANYNFGLATVYAAYQNTSDFGPQLAAPTFAKGTDHDAYNVGVKVPYGNFTFKAQYTSSTVDRTGALSDLDQEKYGLSAAYALSKRTSVYAAVTERSGDLNRNFARRNEYVLGLGHNF